MVVRSSRLLLSGNEAVARAAREARVDLATGYPGTPSTEILESLGHLGGPAQWAPNEKVALEVAIGVSLGRGRALAVMKHVGLNVAADPFFAAGYLRLPGALVIVSADDPGMFSSQNEQDNRWLALAAGIPMLEPSDSQECYDLTLRAFRISERFETPVLVRLTTRVCHSKSVVLPEPAGFLPTERRFERDVPGRVLLPAYSRPAHERLLRRWSELARWAEDADLVVEHRRGDELGIITSGVTFYHVAEAAPDASILKLSLTAPLPIEPVRAFVGRVSRCMVIEEGEPYLYQQLRAEGLEVEGKPEAFRLGELDVVRVRRILRGDRRDDPWGEQADSAPQLCRGCAYRSVFSILRELDCIVAGDIGCYTLGALPPFEAIDSTLCMGASVGIGIGLRHVLPPEDARRVVSVIGDSTFVHGGIPGLVEMLYNQPSSGHVIIILDNETTAMTGQQDHPGTGRTLAGAETRRVDFEALARALGVPIVETHDVKREPERFRSSLVRCLQSGEPAVLVARHPCVLKGRHRKLDSRLGSRSERRDRGESAKSPTTTGELGHG